jgi:hypothetical protein
VPRPRRCRVAVALAVGGLACFAAGAQAAAPANDDYLQSISVNRPGSDLSETQARDVRDTREATVQSDLFAPPSSGGAAERTDCGATRFGATVWYDFHPHVDGIVRVQAAGFDAAIGVYEFDPASARIGSRLKCSNEAGATEELFVEVKRQRSYTIQIGGSDAGLGPATGDLEFIFEYLADRDGDGVLDAIDRCPDQPGTADGCPPELRVLPKLRATATPHGVRVRSLSVAAPRGAAVQVRCRRHCAFSRSRTVRTGSVRFDELRGRRLPAGAQLEIFVTKKRSIGSYIRYTMTRGNFKRVVRCLRPGSRTPRRSCA